MKTAHFIAIVASVLAAATFAAAASYSSSLKNDCDFDVNVNIVLIPGLQLGSLGVITVVAHTVQSVLYTITGLVAGLLGLTWKISAVIDGVLRTVNVVVPLNGTVQIVETAVGTVAVLVNNVVKGYLLQCKWEHVTDPADFRPPFKMVPAPKAKQT
ncbi:hypothetical protein AXG93_2834s1450 [Marchantia polymorpha subsp. ruderalis]|uniref:Uncharacterized protein n=1 Tax=Marchantia polymorpha subsp. ruderalis TaxID=1480154 RepID=A0A176WG80_MARPO|nr:hypothetical protein AXG93_2834s1450 [Marchantia polymorpha subsp. ruderalis]